MRYTLWTEKTGSKPNDPVTDPVARERRKKTDFGKICRFRRDQPILIKKNGILVKIFEGQEWPKNDHGCGLFDFKISIWFFDNIKKW